MTFLHNSPRIHTGSLTLQGACVTYDDESPTAAQMPPWAWDLLASGALIAAALAWHLADRARRQQWYADGYDEGRIAGAIAGIHHYARGYTAAVPGRTTDGGA